jgi:hypothetical protein
MNIQSGKKLGMSDVRRAMNRLETLRTLGNMETDQAALNKMKLILEVWINGNCYKILLDSGSDSDFITLQVVN